MRLVDISLSLPGILIAVLLSVVFEPSFTNVIIVVVFLLWPSYARLVRGETLGIKQQDFVALARVAGCSSLTDHVPPHRAEPGAVDPGAGHAARRLRDRAGGRAVASWAWGSRRPRRRGA